MIGLLTRDPLRSFFDMTEARNTYNVDENENSISITTDLPGVKQEDIQISLETMQAMPQTMRTIQYSLDIKQVVVTM